MAIPSRLFWGPGFLLAADRIHFSVHKSGTEAQSRRGHDKSIPRGPVNVLPAQLKTLKTGSAFQRLLGLKKRRNRQTGRVAALDGGKYGYLRSQMSGGNTAATTTEHRAVGIGTGYGTCWVS
jgi:hypothetical protein